MLDARQVINNRNPWIELTDLLDLRVIHEQQDIRIDKNTAATLWHGEKMDYGLAIEVLLQHAKRGQRVSAETC